MLNILLLQGASGGNMLRSMICSICFMAVICCNAIAQENSANEKLYDVVIRNGMIYDGSGSAPFRGDVAIQGDKVVAVGTREGMKGRTEIDAQGLAVAPGFINMLSWAPDTLIVDGESQSDIRQGVTLEVFGEGGSILGSLNEHVLRLLRRSRWSCRRRHHYENYG